MIKFHCPSCNHKFGAPDDYAGKRVRCSECQQPIRIPKAQEEPVQEKPGRIKFRCTKCNQKIGVPVDYIGKRVKCPKCHQPSVVPGQAAEPIQKEPVAGSAGADDMFDENDYSSDIFGDDKLTQELLAAEANAPAVEEELRLKPAPSQPQTVEAAVPSTDDSIGGGGFAWRGLTIANNVPLAIGASFGAALLGAILWAVIACTTGYELGIVAWGVGVLAGLGLTLFTEGRKVRLGLLAALFAFLGIMMGKFFFANWYVMPELRKQLHRMRPSNEDIEDILKDPDMMFAVACLELADRTQFDQEFAWKVIIARNSGELPTENREEIESAQKKALELLDNWPEDRKRVAARRQSFKILRKIADVMMESKIGLFFVFIATFSPWDLLWFPIALWSAYKIGSGRD